MIKSLANERCENNFRDRGIAMHVHVNGDPGGGIAEISCCMQTLFSPAILCSCIKLYGHKKMYMKKILGTVLVLVTVIQTNGQSSSLANYSLQTPAAITDTTTVIMAAGNQYKASGWKTFWWGKHYRKEWTTPVTFPVLDLAIFAGGLTPIKAGGGHQSKNIRLVSNDEKEYVLRTIDKNLDVLIPDQLKGTFVNDIVNDQISTAHPYGPIAIANMAGTLSFMHTNPTIYYVPDDLRLGEFRSTFANKLCLLEERPSGKGWEHSTLFGNADKIVNTEKLLNEIGESSKNNVDQRAYLNVRLFDLIINDWDRHEDQWIWAMKKEDHRRIYIPIARDRDQAFSKTDGINLYFLSRRWAFRPLQGMHPHVRDVRGANFAARNLDQQFLNELTKDDWNKSVAFIQTQLIDSAIRNGINSMPAEVNEISGNFLTNRLIQRRDNITRDANRFYSIISKNIVINGSDDNEQFIISQDKKKEVSITGIRAKGDTFYHRIFYRTETKQINLYGLGGNDEYVVKGNARNRFTIRMIGGEGTNKYTTDEKMLPGKSYRAYDSVFQEKLSRKFFKSNRRWDTIYRYNRTSVKYDWYMPLIVPGYNPDDDLSIGLGLFYKKQQWGKSPFGWQQRLTIDYATGTSAIGFGYKGLFKQTFGKWDFDLNAFYKGPRYTFNYYGFGNETVLNGHEKSYFRVKANDLFVSPGISRSWTLSTLRFGLQYERVKVLRSPDKYASSPQSDLGSYVFSSINYGGVNGQWTFSNAGDETTRKNGVQLTGGFSFLNNLDSTARKMLKLNAAVSVYHTFFRRLTFAHRTGAATNFGDYEFYHANTLGGEQNLRGFWRNRFTGKSSFYQNTDLRLRLCDFKGYVVRGSFGIFGFVDDGRIWTENDHSSKLHTGYGGGVFLMPYKLAVLSLYYASSDEANIVTLRAGVFF
jgi:hypothetical protein